MNLLQGFGGLSVAGLVTTIGYAYRRFRRSGVSELESFSRYVGQGIKYYVGRYVRRQLAAELMLRQYARVQLKSTAAEMLVPARYPVRLRVDDVFVPLLLRGPTGETFEYRDVAQSSRNRVVIIGEPGSGKSSLLKRAFRDACRQANADPRHSPLPVIFGLSGLADLAPEEQSNLDHDVLFSACTAQIGESAVFNADADSAGAECRPGLPDFA